MTTKHDQSVHRLHRLRTLWTQWSRGELPFTRTMTLLTATLILTFAGDTVRYTIGWPGYICVAVIFIFLHLIALYRRKSPLRIWHVPGTLLLFLFWCGLSTLWSRYPLETLMGWTAQLLTAIAGISIAVSLTRFQFVTALGLAMRLIVYGSLLFELCAAIWWPEGLIPPIYLHSNALDDLLGQPTPHAQSEIPANYYWTYSHLFSGGELQGLPGNRNLLAMVALIALIATSAELWDRRVPRIRGIIAILASAFLIYRTQSATVLIALAFVLLAVALVSAGRHLSRRQRWLMYLGVGVLLVAGASFVVRFNNEIFALMNRSSDMSGRGDIWRSVINLGLEVPVQGIGWISYWAPWLDIFHRLAVVDGTAYHQAHNAFIDAWMQVGTIGLILFVGLVFTALVRTWWVAIDRPDTPVVAPARRHGAPHLAGTTAVPFLILVAFTVQAMTESRLLVEGNWLLLCYWATYAKLRVQDPWLLPRGTVSTRTGPVKLIVDPLRDA